MGLCQALSTWTDEGHIYSMTENVLSALHIVMDLKLRTNMTKKGDFVGFQAVLEREAI